MKKDKNYTMFKKAKEKSSIESKAEQEKTDTTSNKLLGRKSLESIENVENIDEGLSSFNLANRERLKHEKTIFTKKKETIIKESLAAEEESLSDRFKFAGYKHYLKEKVAVLTGEQKENFFYRRDPKKSQMVVKSNRINLEPKGLKNKHYDCFFNAPMQVLLSIPQLVEFYYNKKFETKFSNALQKFIKKYEKTNLVDPDEFIDILGTEIAILDGMQQDTHELLTFFLQKLYRELGGSEKAIYTVEKFMIMREKNFISKTFQGMISSTTQCNTCKRKSVVYEEFTILCLQLKSTVEKACEEAIRKESIDDYECTHCGRSKASKIIEMICFPDVLIIQLKRFVDNTDKDDRGVYVNEKLTLNKNNYRLSGMIKHSGTLTGGHYISEAVRRQVWWHFDDRTIYKMDNPDLTNSDAYILFYAHTL